MESIGVRTIFRYYTKEQDGILEKALRVDEFDELKRHPNLWLAVEFQYHASNPTTFIDPDRAKEDANDALGFARNLSSAKGHDDLFRYGRRRAQFPEDDS
jgi:hypothetical protein